MIVWLLILLCCKSAKSFLVDKYSQRITRGDKNINTEVKLVVVNCEALKVITNTGESLQSYNSFRFSSYNTKL